MDEPQGVKDRINYLKHYIRQIQARLPSPAPQ